MTRRNLTPLAALAVLLGMVAVPAAPTSAAVAAVPAAEVAPAAAEQLPDLRMARLTDFGIQTTSSGRKRLRFSTRIVNVGEGKFEVRGSRPDTATSRMAASQRIFSSDGSFRTVPVTGTDMFYAGDGHDHWHLDRLQKFTLKPLGQSTVVGRGAKTGFCFFDNVAFRTSMPGSPSSPQYTSCGNQSSLKVRMGLSVGWGDLYDYRLAGQYIDITGLPDGDYRVRVTADRSNWFQESNDTNNHTWTDIRIRSGSVTVLKQGPAA